MPHVSDNLYNLHMYLFTVLFLIELFHVEVLMLMFLTEFNYEFVTCGSALKLLNAGHGVRLHSHDVKYGSGSGQQVTKYTSCSFH